MNLYSKVHRKSYWACVIIIIGEKDESKCHRMRVPTCGIIIMTELYSKVYRITVGTYDIIIMGHQKTLKDTRPECYNKEWI